MCNWPPRLRSRRRRQCNFSGRHRRRRGRHRRRRSPRAHRRHRRRRRCSSGGKGGGGRGGAGHARAPLKDQMRRRAVGILVVALPSRHAQCMRRQQILLGVRCRLQRLVRRKRRVRELSEIHALLPALAQRPHLS